MNRILIGAIVIVVVALGAIGFLLSKTAKQTVNNTPRTLEEAIKSETSLRELMNLSTSQQCSFRNEENTSQGNIFIGGGKMRADFSITQDEKMVSSHMVSDGNNIYIWSEDMEAGVKIPLAMVDDTTKSAQGRTESVDLDQKGTYDCSSWQVDNSKFETPNIEFSDLGALFMTEESLETKDSSESQAPEACAVCDSLPVESQAQCKAALGC